MRTIVILKLIAIYWLFGLQLFAQSQRYKGYPQKNTDIVSAFANPPKGYGNVPFYWWNGDSLNRERMKEQLEIISTSATDGFAVSYIHLDPEVDKEEMKGGYGLFGKTEAGRPQAFSKEWWEFWNWFSHECAQKNIGLGMDDYTIGWTGNGFYTDELLKEEKFQNYQGELEFFCDTVSGGETFSYTLPKTFIAAVAWPGKIDLSEFISGNQLVWKIPDGKEYKVYVLSTKKSHLLHPDIGKAYLHYYFDRFEKNMGDATTNGMNYFFQDELYYPIKMGSWSEDFKEEFQKRKGYDITLYLPALQANIGEETPKIRLDYCDVLMDLAEERYFQPIYNWHASRGLIYGSDNFGRGKQPLAYIDYFRANSWYTAPGNDAPSKGSSFIQTKVSSSIAHLYERPRTWLEAFHSMGWGSTGSWLTQQMDHHFMAGGNLVCMHGLYYSTHGGWWEWAPPCFHFRMPYWPHMKQWLQYTERLSFLMSQGTHVCDIALMYPTESMQAYPEANANEAFDQALKLSNAGLDYDFMNYGSLRKAQVEKGHLSIAGEKYRVLVLADMKAMHYSSLLKIRDFYRAGGIVVATGELPKASTNRGEKDAEADAIIREIFGGSSQEISQGKKVKREANSAGGMGVHVAADEVAGVIKSLILPDFMPETGVGKVLHRRIDERDVYMVMDVPKGTECFFRTLGKVELWDATDGSRSDYPIVRQTAEGTWLRLDKEPTNSYLFVFSKGEPTLLNTHVKEPQLVYKAWVKGPWETELLPTLDNKWGDYRLPASGLIGAEARSFKHSPDALAPKNWMCVDFDDSDWPESVYGYGPQFKAAYTTSDMQLDNVLHHGKQVSGELLEFSWQYGVFDNPGSQGWHGLKGKVSDGFFILDRGSHQIYESNVYVPATGTYRIETEGVQPDHLLIDRKQTEGSIQLDKGWHSCIFVYANTEKGTFKFQKSEYRDFRKRGAVVLFPQSSATPAKPSAYDKVISTRWALGDHLLYDPYGGENLTWNYRFRSVPGMKEMEMDVAGEILNVWFEGKPVEKRNIQLLSEAASGIKRYRITFPQIQKEVGLVAFSIQRKPGYQGAAAIVEPIRIQTGKGLMEAGNWSDTGALKYYSGGMYYRKRMNLPVEKTGSKVILDLGDVNASCEMKVNGKKVGMLMSPPYKMAIEKYIQPGENEVEILVYSTLSNHYQTIPTPYRGEGVAGLLGPVSLSIYE